MMLPSQLKSRVRTSIAFPFDLAEAMDLLVALRNYENRSRYIVGLIRADIANGVDHAVPHKIEDFGPRQQAKLDAACLDIVRRAADQAQPA